MRRSAFAVWAPVIMYVVGIVLSVEGLGRLLAGLSGVLFVGGVSVIATALLIMQIQTKKTRIVLWLLIPTTVLVGMLGFGRSQSIRYDLTWGKYSAEITHLFGEELPTVVHDVSSAYMHAREADIYLRVLGDTAAARDQLQVAVEFAKENGVAGIGRFGTAIPIEVQRLLPDIRFRQVQGETVLDY